MPLRQMVQTLVLLRFSQDLFYTLYFAPLLQQHLSYANVDIQFLSIFKTISNTLLQWLW